jgi:hypothetical protein
MMWVAMSWWHVSSCLLDVLISSMELSFSWEAANCSAAQELPNILWKLKIHYPSHKSLLLVPILRHMNPVYTTRLYFSNIHFNIVLHICLALANGLFNSVFPTVTWYLPLHNLYIAERWLDHLSHVWWRVQVMKLLIVQFSQASCHFIPLRTNLLYVVQ